MVLIHISRIMFFEIFVLIPALLKISAIFLDLSPFISPNIVLPIPVCFIIPGCKNMHPCVVTPATIFLQSMFFVILLMLSIPF